MARLFRSIRDGSSPSLYWLIPLAIGCIYLTLFALELPKIIELSTWNSDVASAFTIPITLVQTGTGGHTVLASTGAYIELWFGILTASLPFHRLLWEIAAPLTYLATALTVGWSVAQVATRRASVLAILLCLVVSAPAFTIFMAAATHNSVYLGTALLGAYLVWMARSGPQTKALAVSVPLLLGVALGIFFASDLLLLVTGIVPFAFTATFVSLQRNERSKRLFVSVLAIILVGAPVAWLTSKAMGSYGLVVERPSTSIVFSELPRHSEYLFEGVKELFGGYLGGQAAPGKLQTVVGIASDVAMTFALFMLPVFGCYTAVKFAQSKRRIDVERTPPDFAITVHILYWTASAISAVVAFELSAMADAARAQYYATLIFSVAAIIPLLLRPASLGGRLVPFGASVFFIASIVSLTSANFGIGEFRRDQQRITLLAQTDLATTGYAGYWYASDLTWNSHERVKVRPVSLCENTTGADICPFYINRVPSWYKADQHRSFLLVNPHEEYLYVVPPGLGRPLATYTFQDSTKMYVYPYDIASRLGPGADRP